ncbi:MAG: PaaI family thioesterase [Rhizobiaceae bacterium]
MAEFTIRNENYVERVRGSFERQPFMKTIGAKLTEIGPGFVEIAVPFSDGVTQQHGFFHGGLIGTIADNAGGYAAFTLMAASDSVLSVEYKLNLMAPANGDLLISRGHVLKSGRTLTVCQSDIYVVRDGVEHNCATMLGTFMTMVSMSDEPDNDRSRKN